MALDLNIQIFANQCFYDAWEEFALENAKEKTLLLYGDECTISNIDVWDKMFHKAIACRYLLFSNIYLDAICFRDDLKFGSISDISSCMTYLFENEYLFGDLNVFEKIFATCALAHHILDEIKLHGRKDISKYGDIIWAMYFDKFAEKFYKEGGWNELKRRAKTYYPLFKFIKLYYEENMTTNLWKALKNYRQFKNSINHICNKKRNEKVHISMLWIKFQTVNFKNPVTISSRYVDNVKNSDIEKLLQELKLVINFYPECDTDNSEVLEDKLEGKLLGPNFYSKNEKTCTKNAELICTSAVNKTAATSSKKDENPKKNLNSTEGFPVVGDGKRNCGIDLKKREEQEDPEMINYLRMILVLGDRQGTQNVFETLFCKEEDKKSSSKKSKKKKRSKNKSRK